MKGQQNNITNTKIKNNENKEPFTKEEQTKFGVALTRKLFNMVNNDDSEGKSEFFTEFRKNILLDFRNSIDNKNNVTENQVIKELNQKKTYKNIEELLDEKDKKKEKENFMLMVQQLRENCGNMYNSYNKHKEYDILFYMVDDLFNEIEELDNFIENRDIYIGHLHMISSVFVSYVNDMADNMEENTNGYFLLELFKEIYGDIIDKSYDKISGISKVRDSFIKFEESKDKGEDVSEVEGVKEGEAYINDNFINSQSLELDRRVGGKKGGSYKKKLKRKRKHSKKKTLKKKRKNKRKSKK